MKIRTTCKLPSEILGVGYALAGIIAVGALILGVQFIIVNYGAAVMDFQTKNAVTIGYIILFLVWAVPAGLLEDILKSGSKEERLAVMIIGTLLALAVAAMVAYDDKTGFGIGLGLFFFFFQLVSMLIGWLGHWCYRCVKIERDVPAGEGL